MSSGAESKRQYGEIIKELKGAKKVLLSTHRSPDGDAIGSSLGMQHFLSSLGVESEVVVPDEFPKFLKWMNGVESIIHFDKEEEKVKALIEECDVLLSLDYNVLYRTGGKLAAELDGFLGTKIMIDHHRQPAEDYDYYLHDIGSCSTAQLVFDLIEQTGHLDSIDVPMAECIYAGILTDSGSFRFPSTSPHTHELTAKLMRAGLDVSKVYNLIYDTNSLDRLRLLGLVLNEKLKILGSGSTAYFTLSLKELNAHHYQPGDTEGFVNYALSIEGVKFACIFKENEKGTKMSFRSKGDWDVNTFARKHFDGGGHLNAAGGFIKASLLETEQLFLNAIREYPELGID